MALYLGSQKVCPIIKVGGDDIGITREVSDTGVYQKPTQSFTFKLPDNATDMGSSSMRYAFYQCTGLTSADLSSLTTISGSNAMSYAFYNCTSLTSVDLSNLTTVSGAFAMQYAFQDCSNLTSVDLSSLTTISNNAAMSSTFAQCTSLTSVDLSNLTKVSGLSSTFSGCSNLTSVDLSSLTTVSSGALYLAFSYCTSLTSLSFPALTSTSVRSHENYFKAMLEGVTGCTVHFPSNLQSVMEGWSDVTNGFGGTNTAVLFDLPATT